MKDVLNKLVNLLIEKLILEKKVDRDNILLIGINRDKPTPRVNASNAIALAHLDFSTYYGTIEIFLCKKKKGLFGKETLKCPL